MNIARLYERFQQFPKAFTDSRKSNEGGIFFALKGDRFDGNDFALAALEQGAHWAVVDRPNLAINKRCIVVDEVLSTLQQLANFHRSTLTIPLIAITGTNGKTTTKELTAEVLGHKYKVLATQGNLNNHIGVPLTLLSIKAQHEIAIIEMGANHPGEIENLCKIAQPNYGLITNVGKAHLEGFGSFEGVTRTKGELYRFLNQHDSPIFLNAGNAHLTALLSSNNKVLTYGLSGTNTELIGEVASSDPYLTAKILFPKGWLYLRTQLTGDYNLENVLAAARIGVHFGVDPLQIQEAIENYQPGNNRSQLTKTGKNTLLLDCYNANPTSMEASVRNFLQLNHTNKVFILGDMLELGDSTAIEHQKIADLLIQNKAAEVFLIGKNFGETITPVHFKKFTNVDALNHHLETEEISNRYILVKGSRGISLEKCAQWL